MGLARIPVEHDPFHSFAIEIPARALSPRNPYLPNGVVILTVSTRGLHPYLIHAIRAALFPDDSSTRAPMVCGGKEAGPWTSSPGMVGGCPSPRLKVNARAQAPRLDLAHRSGHHRRRGLSPPGPARQLAEASHNWYPLLPLLCLAHGLPELVIEHALSHLHGVV
jgi:hypothetical protein